MSKEKRNEPTLKEWEDLYEAAIDFRKIECWEWMYDSDLFGIQNPDTEEIGYCGVLGGLGEVFALNVFLGENGLKGYFKMMNQKQTSKDSEILYLQDCLMASFGNRNELASRDLKIIKKLDLKFRGKNQWPIFRRYKPGFFPWFPTKEEVKFLTIALQQAKKIALRSKENNELLNPPEEGLFYVLVPDKKGGAIKWQEKWLKQELKPEGIYIPILSDSYIEKIKSIVTSEGNDWEIDYFYAPFTIQKKKDEIPYYPFICLFIERSMGLIIDTHIAKSSDYLKEFLDTFLNIIEYNKMIPSKIFVKRKKCYFLLEQITEELGIKLQLVKKLGELNKAKKEFFKRMQTNRGF